MKDAFFMMFIHGLSHILSGRRNPKFQFVCKHAPEIGLLLCDVSMNELAFT
jgi:hypothetical protein